MDNQLSEHLTLEEFQNSDTAIAKGIANAIPETLINNAKDWAEQVFEPVRVMLGVPVRISSGYRCQALNKAVGGVETSQHISGMAGDMVPVGMPVLNAFLKILQSDLKFDQLIDERGKDNSKWIHISYCRDKNRNEIVIYDGVKYKYKTRQDAIAWVNSQLEVG